MIDSLMKLVALSRARQLSSYEAVYDLTQWWTRHRDSIVEDWYFYAGLHKLFFTPYDGEDKNDFIARIRYSTVENHIKPIIDIIVSHLYDGPDKLKRYPQRKEEVDAKLLEWFKESVWTYQNQQDLNGKKALNALVTGYSILQRTLVDIRTGKIFPVTATTTERVKYGVIFKRLLDSTFSVPFPYIDENGLIDPTRLGAVVTICDNDNYLGSPMLMDALGRALSRTQMMEYVDDRVWLRWTRANDTSDWVQQTMYPGTPYENKNPYGSIEVAFAVYSNTGDPFYIEGDSDITQLKEISIELNELGSSDKAVINYHSNPILAGYGGAELPNNFVRSKHSHVHFERKYTESRLEYVVWDGKLDASEKRQMHLRHAMSFLSGVSLISRGFLSEIGQIRSGPPLKALFSSERALLGRKFTAFGAAESKDMRNDVLFWEKATGQSLNVDKTVSYIAEFAQDFLGIDKLLEEEIRALQAQSGSETPKEILEQAHPDWTEAEIEEALKQIEKTKQTQKAKIMSKSPDRAGQEQK